MDNFDMDLLPVSQLNEFSVFLDSIGMIEQELYGGPNSIVKMSKKGPKEYGFFSIKAVAGISGDDFLMIQEFGQQGRSKLLAKFKEQRRKSA